MATKWTSPTWRMPDEQNQSKFENYSLSFDGAENIDIGNTISVSGNCTVSFWFKVPAIPNSTPEVMFARYTGSGDTDFLIIGLYLQGVLASNNSNAGGSKTTRANVTLSPNIWHHCAVTKVSGVVTNIYIDGTDRAGSVGSFEWWGAGSTDSGFIGQKANSDSLFDGEIEQLAVFDYTLTSTQISYLYNSGTPQNPMAISGNAPIAYYPLGGGSTGDAAVSSPSTLTIPNESVPSATVFDFASGDQINITNPTFLDNITEFTISFWYNKGNLNNPTGSIISRGATPNGFGLDQFRNQGGSANAFYFRVDSSSGTKGFYTSANPTNVGEWAHVCLVWNSTNQIIYVNGIDIKNEASLGGTLNGSGNNLIIGNSGTSLFYDLSNFQIWNSTLLPSEITTLYNYGSPLSGTQPQAANLKAWYKMNVENANWLGSDWQIADATSAYPQSFDFNGATGIIPLPQGSLQLVTSISISAWVKTTTTGTRQTIISNDNVSSGGPPPNAGRSWNFLVNGQNINFTLRPENDAAGTIYSNIITSGVNVADNNWHSVVALWDGTTNTNSQKVFVDGILRAQGTPSFTQPMRQYEFNKPTIGDQAGQTQFWDWEGEMSNIQVWESALTYGTVSSLGDAAGGEVAQLYNNGSPLTTAIASSNLKGWYKLNNNEIWDGSNWEVENQAYPASYESALNFDATPALITIPDSSALRFVGTDFSISFWLRPKASGNQIIMDKYGPAVAGWGVYLQSGNLRFLSYLPSNWQTMTTVSQNVWTHILIVGDNTGQNLICYKNGTEVYNAAYALGVISNTTDLIVGTENSSGSLDYVGDLSNLVIWDSNQSSEKDNIYNSGTPANSYTNTPVGWWKLDNVTTGIQDISGSSNGVITGNVTKVNTFVSTEIGVSSGMTESNLVNNNVSTLNGTSSGMTTANLVNSDLTRSIPYSSYSMDFDGANDKINLGDSDTFSFGNGSTDTALSFSIWINLTTLSAPNCVINKQTSSSNGEYKIYILTSGKIYIELANNGGEANGARGIQSGTNLSIDQWYHLTFTYDGRGGSTAYDGMNLYINGSLDSSTDWSYLSYTAMNNTNADLILGDLITGGSNPYDFNGSMSNYSIWNSELTQDQILTIYNGGVPNNISSLSPTGWWSLAGDSYYDGTDFICPDLSSNSNNGTSSGMGGTELVGNGPGSTANGTATGMNIPANLQGNAPNSTKNAFSINMSADDKTSSVPDISS